MFLRITVIMPSESPNHTIIPKRNVPKPKAYLNKFWESELFQFFPWNLRVNSFRDRRTSFNLFLASSSIKSPSLLNFAGGWNALRKNSGLLMKWRSRNTPIWRRWYCDLPPPKPPPALTMAAGLPAQTFGALDAQSSAFFNGPSINESMDISLVFDHWIIRYYHHIFKDTTFLKIKAHNNQSLDPLINID